MEENDAITVLVGVEIINMIPKSRLKPEVIGLDDAAFIIIIEILHCMALKK